MDHQRRRERFADEWQDFRRSCRLFSIALRREWKNELAAMAAEKWRGAVAWLVKASLFGVACGAAAKLLGIGE